MVLARHYEVNCPPARDEKARNRPYDNSVFHAHLSLYLSNDLTKFCICQANAGLVGKPDMSRRLAPTPPKVESLFLCKKLLEQLFRQFGTFLGQRDGFGFGSWIRDVALFVQEIHHLPIMPFPSSREVMDLE